jgi:hypothetical protein
VSNTHINCTFELTRGNDGTDAGLQTPGTVAVAYKSSIGGIIVGNDGGVAIPYLVVDYIYSPTISNLENRIASLENRIR